MINFSKDLLKILKYCAANINLVILAKKNQQRFSEFSCKTVEGGQYDVERDRGRGVKHKRTFKTKFFNF